MVVTVVASEVPTRIGAVEADNEKGLIPQNQARNFAENCVRYLFTNFDSEMN